MKRSIWWLRRDLRLTDNQALTAAWEQADAEVLARLMAETGAAAVYAEADVSPYARQRDGRVAQQLPLILTAGLTVQPPDAVRKENGQPYTVYTPFSKKWQALPWSKTSLPAPDLLRTPDDVDSLPLPSEPTLPSSVPFTPGEAAARERLLRFIAGAIAHYGEGRNRMDLAGTSGLSPYLRCGMILVRMAAAAAVQAATNATAGKGA